MKRPVDPQSQASAQEDTDDNLAAAYSCPMKVTVLQAACCSFMRVSNHLCCKPSAVVQVCYLSSFECSRR